MAYKSKKTSILRKAGSQEKFVRANMMSIILTVSGFLAAVALIAGWVTPVTDEMIGRPPFASQSMLELVASTADTKFMDAKQTAEQALEKSTLATEAIMYIQLDRAINQVTTARDRAERDPRNRDAQTDLLRAESNLRQIEDRVKRYEQVQTQAAKSK